MRRDDRHSRRARSELSGRSAMRSATSKPSRDDVDARVGQVQVDLDAGMRGEELGERPARRCAMPKRHRRGEADEAGGRAGGVARGFLGGAAPRRGCARRVRRARLPLSVSARRREVRWNSDWPRRASSRVIAFDTVALDRPSASAARAERAMLDDGGEDRPGFEIGQAHCHPRARVTIAKRSVSSVSIYARDRSAYLGGNAMEITP